jgi:cyclic beta-1,2-glucan synthetase
MLTAAYALLGLEFENGRLRPRADAFEPKGGLRLESVTYRGETFETPGDE